MNQQTTKRKKVVKQAVANERLEGLEVSRESKLVADNYVVGKLSAQEAAAKIRKRFGSL